MKSGDAQRNVQKKNTNNTNNTNWRDHNIHNIYSKKSNRKNYSDCMAAADEMILLLTRFIEHVAPEFMFSVASLKSYSIQREIDDKARHALGRGYWLATSQSRFNQTRTLSQCVLSL